MKPIHLATALLICTSLTPMNALADDAASGVITSYSLVDFEIYAPRTALDMATRVPGFSIQGDSDGSRGFGQASGNVLINGQRLSGKSNTAEDALKRIPASSVERIEILDGSTLDIPGLSGQVMNIVAQQGSTSGAFTWRSRFREDLPPLLSGVEASLTGATGDIGWSVGLTSTPAHQGSDGRENRYEDGVLTLYREERFHRLSDTVAATGSLSWTPANGIIANINGEYSINQWDSREQSEQFLADGTPDQLRLFGRSEDEIETEVSGDIEFGLGPGRLKLIALNRYENSPFNTTIRDFSLSNGAFLSASRNRRVVDEGETIFRSEYSWSFSEGSDWQVSLEGAFNYLDDYTDFLTGNASNDFVVRTDRSPTTTGVEENRAEAFISNTRSLSPALSLQMSLGVEQSEISSDQTNLTTLETLDQSDAFTRPKGEIALTYAPRDERTYTLSFKRDVGQLNFFDFVPSNNLDLGVSSAGNPGIVPQQSWVGEFKTEAGFGDFGAATLILFGEAIEDIIDQVPLGNGAEGPGNLDSAFRYGYELDATLRLDPIGLTGVEINIESSVTDSEVDDPLTGEPRRISGDSVYDHEIALRHDIPQTDLAWGIQYNVRRNADRYRLDSITEDYTYPGFMFAFLEHKNIFGLTGTVFVGNWAEGEDRFRREFYRDSRETGDLAFIEDRTRGWGKNLTFRLSGSF